MLHKISLNVKFASDKSLGIMETPFVYDRYVLPGVELGFYGAGVEYFPIREAKQALRFHAFWCSNTSEPVQQTFNVGLRWQMDLLNR